MAQTIPVQGPDGKIHFQTFYTCPKCKDTGLITWVDEKGYAWGQNCDCEKGRGKKSEEAPS